MQIIDNRNTFLVDDLKKVIKAGDKLSIAASCFSIYAYAALKEELENIDELKFIFKEPTFTEKQTIADKINKERREFFIPEQIRESSIYGTEFEIKLRNQLTQKAIAKECSEWIKRKARFKSNNTGKVMPSVINVKGDKSTLYAGVDGFTSSGIGAEPDNNLFSCIMKVEGEETRSLFSDFNSIWNSEVDVVDVTSKILAHIESAYKENSPDFIYYYALFNIFSDYLSDLDEDSIANERTGFKESKIWNTLYNFQKDGVKGIINKLEKYRGCILADSVGLGKTFTALAVMQYYSLKNKSILVLCPKRLGDNWNQYKGNTVSNIFYADKVHYDVLYHTDLGRKGGYSNGINLNTINWGNYDLVVIDESHNFRNANPTKSRMTRYDFLMEKIMKDGIRTRVLMLSATPVNNRYNDLRNQIALAYEGDYAAFNNQLDTKKGVQEIFRQAQSTFNAWSKLPNSERKNSDLIDRLDIDFRVLLDSVTIARSRKNITKFYDVKDIGNFPKRKTPLSYRCDLTDIAGVINYEDMYSMMDQLKLSVYAPFDMVLPSRKGYYAEALDVKAGDKGGVLGISTKEAGLKKLMISLMLKRLESSIYAFKSTALKMIDKNKSMLEKVNKYLLTKEDDSITKTIYNYETYDDPDEDGGIAFDRIDNGTDMQFSLKDMDCITWKRDLENDLDILKEMYRGMMDITPEHDSKLIKLKELISSKISHPINNGNKKLLIFTASADTAVYLYDCISSWAKNSFGINTAMVQGGNSSNKCTLSGLGQNTDEILTLFSPVSKNRDLLFSNRKDQNIDILIATDCISEGQNLQDCDICINYDIHWNPVRIVQRFGRIDRIGSKNAYIQLVNFWPNVALDKYINLNSKVESRMAIVDNTTGASDNLLTDEQVDYEYRALQIQKLQKGELQDLEDVDGSITLTDIGLSDFKMDIVDGRKRYGDPYNIPKGLHAVIPVDSESGLEEGVIYVLKNINSQVEHKSQNQLGKYYLVYVHDDNIVELDHSKFKEVLDLIRSGCKGRDEPIIDSCRAFNKQTKDGYKMNAYSIHLEKAISSIIDTEKENDLKSLFIGGGTTALDNAIEGMNDFELVCFVVIK